MTAEGLFWDDSEQKSRGIRTLPHTTYGDTKVTKMWVLLAQRRPAGRFQLIASDPSQSGEQHAVSPTRYFETMGGRVFGWQVVEPESGATYKAHWLME